MRDLFRKMFNGWMLVEASWNGERYERDPVECMIEACGGDEQEGYVIYLFDHWGNDIQSMSGYWGISLERDAEGKLFIDEGDHVKEKWEAEQAAYALKEKRESLPEATQSALLMASNTI